MTEGYILKTKKRDSNFWFFNLYYS